MDGSNNIGKRGRRYGREALGTLYVSILAKLEKRQQIVRLFLIALKNGSDKAPNP